MAGPSDSLSEVSHPSRQASRLPAFSCSNRLDWREAFSAKPMVAFNFFKYKKQFTVATLPSPAVIGMEAVVSDATSPAMGAVVTGGGSAKAKVWYNGTAWRVTGV